MRRRRLEEQDPGLAEGLVPAGEGGVDDKLIIMIVMILLLLLLILVLVLVIVIVIVIFVVVVVVVVVVVIIQLIITLLLAVMKLTYTYMSYNAPGHRSFEVKPSPPPKSPLEGFSLMIIRPPENMSLIEIVIAIVITMPIFILRIRS